MGLSGSVAATCERPVNREDYVAVSVSMLVPSKLCGVALYTREGADEPVRLFRGSEFPITQQDLDALHASGRKKLYVSATEHRQFQAYLRESLDSSLTDESLSVTQRFDMLNEVVRDVLGEAFRAGQLDDTVSQTAELGQRTVDMICREDTVASELRGVLYHDYHTFTHSANVAYYCVMLAKDLGITDRDTLNQIAAGSLLHDLGKLEIPEAILTKPGKLTDQEFGVIKRHPTIGFRKLCQRKDLSYAQLMMVYQHHERLDGKGYPVGVGGDEVHEWARICAVADVFEALTSNRPYRAGMTPKAALEIMDRSAGTGFDARIYQCWKATIKQS
jgi:HD-GYP domain-containing protein (c-di-GMP phosphodiesterase class II)